MCKGFLTLHNIQTMKDPAVVGHYDALLTFSDHKAERFFATHGFSEDPILTAKYRYNHTIIQTHIIATWWRNASHFEFFASSEQ